MNNDLLLEYGWPTEFSRFPSAHTIAFGNKNELNPSLMGVHVHKLLKAAERNDTRPTEDELFAFYFEKWVEYVGGPLYSKALMVAIDKSLAGYSRLPVTCFTTQTLQLDYMVPGSLMIGNRCYSVAKGADDE